MATVIKAYWLPLILCAASIFFQLVVIPRSFPVNHYDGAFISSRHFLLQIPLFFISLSSFTVLFVVIIAVLGIKRYSSIEEVHRAYQKLSSSWNSGLEAPHTIDFIKIQYAFELLTNQLWKRDYDLFGIDEQVDVIEKAKEQYTRGNSSEIGFPLLKTASFDPEGRAFDAITSENLQAKFGNTSGLLAQILSLGSKRCALFSDNWKRIGSNENYESDKNTEHNGRARDARDDYS
ncbi:hypothetical protein RJ639_016963 [Escallonia herrerae]|uniref:J domain-containing protein n=1 Tax=Escallonia herrerae TaxID=1293975 RepID=A0AA88VFX8_9ASTE|nr:hypothetical protein RJ639_016963 [Escallonia herrerae]